MKNSSRAQMIKGTLWVHFEGRTFSVDDNPGRAARKKSGKASSDQLVAPMPGKITKILLKEGDAVKAGQAVLMMEAMKMEYTLKADMDGAIESLQCQVGEQVILGKVLAKLKA